MFLSSGEEQEWAKNPNHQAKQEEDDNVEEEDPNREVDFLEGPYGSHGQPTGFSDRNDLF